MFVADTGRRAKPATPELHFDADGFLIDSASWTPQAAQLIAISVGVADLEEQHLTIVRYIRAHYTELGTYATPRRICSVLDVDRDQMKRFFRTCMNAWKIAGLPNPGEEARSYMQ